MKKIIALLSTFSIASITTLNIIACSTNNGQKVNVEYPNAPKEATEQQDPVEDYVYNSQYKLPKVQINIAIAIAAQLLTDKLRDNKDQYSDDKNYKDLYDSQAWKFGSFTSFKYDVKDFVSSNSLNIQDFSYQIDNGQLIFDIDKNDASVDNNIKRTYWFITSSTSNICTSNIPKADNIVIPTLRDFDSQKIITRSGWIPLIATIGNFNIKFTAQINFYFNKYIDVKGIPKVIVNSDTFNKPFGQISFDNPKEVYNNKIKIMSIKLK